jgi:hypothetical protein
MHLLHATQRNGSAARRKSMTLSRTRAIARNALRAIRAEPLSDWSWCWAQAFQITKTSHLLLGYNHTILMNALTDSTMDEKSEDSRIF